tara:strand:+ start:256 stop:543 length:288 start_codon:yes stop_codon:yes gene_type:complete
MGRRRGGDELAWMGSPVYGLWKGGDRMENCSSCVYPYIIVGAGDPVVYCCEAGNGTAVEGDLPIDCQDWVSYDEDGQAWLESVTEELDLWRDEDG